MVALPQTFNVADLPDSGGGNVLIPAGTYKAVIVSSDLAPTKTGGQSLNLKIVITDGQYAHTELTDRLNVINSNEVAVQIAYKTLARISESLGMDRTPQDSNEIHNKPLLIVVETEAGTPYKDKDGVTRDGKDKSIIKGYKAVGAAVVGFAPAQAPQAALASAPAASAPPPWAAKK